MEILKIEVLFTSFIEKERENLLCEELSEERLGQKTLNKTRFFRGSSELPRLFKLLKLCQLQLSDFG